MNSATLLFRFRLVISIVAFGLASVGICADEPFSMKIEEGEHGPTVLMENHLCKAVYAPIPHAEKNWEHAFVDWELKSRNQDQVHKYVDASAHRGQAKSAVMVHDGTDRKTVRLEYEPYKEFVPAIVEYTIYPDSPIIRIDYVQTPTPWCNTVDIGQPGGAKKRLEAETRIYGQEKWPREIVYHEDAYWVGYDKAGKADAEDAGALNYKGHLIMAVANPENGIGFGRVMPIYKDGKQAGVRILKLLWDQGFETFLNCGDKDSFQGPCTGYVFLFENGLDEAIRTGQTIVDRSEVRAEESSPSTQNSGIFFEQKILDEENLAYQRAVGDVNQDVLNDVVTASQGVLSYYKAPKFERVVLRDIADFKDFKTLRADDLKLADIDGDGDLDAITRIGVPKNDRDGMVVWFENPLPKNAVATPWPRHDVGANQYVKNIIVKDFDADGKLDIATREHSATQIWFQDNADAWVKKQLDHAALEALEAADLDGDGDLDLVLNGFWFETPENPREGEYLLHSIDTMWYEQNDGIKWQRNNSKVAVADIDGDKHLDVVISQCERTDFPVVWYSAKDPRKGPWEKHVIVERLNYCHTLKTADFNLDGHVDVLVGGMPKEENPDAGLTLLLGNGGREWKSVPIQQSGSYSAVIGDLQDDGDQDIVNTRSYDERPFEVWINQLNQADSQSPASQPATQASPGWTYIQIDSSRAKFGDWGRPKWTKYFGLGWGDVDRDGDLDVVSGRYVYINPGGDMEQPWKRVDVGVNADASLVVDADGDEFADLIAPAGDQILWLEAKTATADEFTSHTIDSKFKRPGHGTPQGYKKAQIIPGGREEVLLPGVEEEFAVIYCYTIPDDPSAGDWPRTRIATHTSDEGIGVGDIDGDGLLDIAVAYRPKKPGKDEKPPNTSVQWRKNPGDGSADWPMVVVGEIGGPYCDRVEIADLNNDGRGDIIATEETQAREPVAQSFWFEAPADPAQGENWKRHLLVKQFTTNSLDVGDINKDGNTDVILAEHRGPKKLAVWFNDGKGNLTEHVIDTGKENHLGARVADLDQDGDLDILGIAWDEHRFLHLWRNDN